ncbi:NADPH2:quinone reductase [Haloactinospora alba]|uniref:NADPH2:quinone reductase n=1 Tax=Haloactinospora alba TaxID=405555 RepID=A0A543NIP8_9ACTN|nr:zinc-binding dehydrogenase [Haloactinospora alba]TQN31624.1 NADPH2:quinone reductase [Haloactinospora alba]
MRAVQVTRFGGPEVLVTTEQPDPVAGVGQVVVDVSATEVLFLDTQLRSGAFREHFAVQPPYVPGTGVAGTVSSVGRDVDPGWIGRRVVAGTAREGEYAGGGCAERAAAPISEVFEVPEGLDLSGALAGLHDGLMALSLAEKAALQPGERVLVNAAGGSLGVWLVPLARAAGARVIAAARGERKLRQARQLGADVAVDYSESGWTELVGEATDGSGVDVVFDGAGGQMGRSAFAATADGGRFFSYGAATGGVAVIDPGEAERRQVTVVGVEDEITPQDWARLAKQALSELAEGRIKPVIGQTLPLERAADAHAAIAARNVAGKTVLLA